MVWLQMVVFQPPDKFSFFLSPQTKLVMSKIFPIYTASCLWSHVAHRQQYQLVSHLQMLKRCMENFKLCTWRETPLKDSQDETLCLRRPCWRLQPCLWWPSTISKTLWQHKTEINPKEVAKYPQFAEKYTVNIYCGDWVVVDLIFNVSLWTINSICPCVMRVQTQQGPKV